METVWFCIIAFMIAAYVVLDGFDLGAGIVHRFVARTDAERRLVLKSIGPVWDGNEVWLIASGGALFLAFPALYAAAFSGFYLPLMIALWLLIGRGIAIEFRRHADGPVWRPFWDAIFSVSSALLALCFGAALGNVVRGVPFEREGVFFEPLWTDLTPAPPTGVIDGYTLLVGMTAVAALAMHGALWLVVKTEGELHDRARRTALRCGWAVLLLTALVAPVTFAIQPHVLHRLEGHPWGLLFPALALAGLAGSLVWNVKRREVAAFLASCAYLAGMVASAAFGIYPYVLPSNTHPLRALTIENAAASHHGLAVGLAWFVPGLLLVAGAFIFVYRKFAGKVRDGDDGY